MAKVVAWVFVLALLAAAALGARYAWRKARAANDPLALARTAYAERDWRAANAQALRHLRKEPHNRDALRLLARTSARLGQARTAQTLYLGLGSEGAVAEDFYLLASTLLAEHHDDQARGLLEQALALESDHPDALHALAELCLRQDYYLAGVPLAERLHRIKGWQARGNWDLGRLRALLFDPSGAATAFEVALLLDPQGRTLDVAPGALRKRLARALLQLGRPSEARNTIEPVVQGASGGVDREAAWLLSRTHLQEGNWALASAALAQAGDFHESDPMAFEPASYVGSAACADCHAATYRSQQSSHHAHTFATGQALAKQAWPPQPLTDPRDRDVSFEFASRAEGVRIHADVNKHMYDALVLYALGSGSRATTFVVRDGANRMREFRVSRFAKDVGWDLTLHHPDRPSSPDGYLGNAMPADSLRNCVHCHSTDFRAALEGTGPEAADHGIGCERCHGPGGNHLKAVAGKFADMAIVQPKAGSAQERSALCAQCHQGPRGADVNAPDFVRFQGPNIARSRCYTESDGNFDCITCHNPHRNAETSAAHYEAICLQCHIAKRETEKAAGRGNACPVNPRTDCLSCHMPTIPDAVPHTPFTDHYIRVHR